MGATVAVSSAAPRPEASPLPPANRMPRQLLLFKEKSKKKPAGRFEGSCDSCYLFALQMSEDVRYPLFWLRSHCGAAKGGASVFKYLPSLLVDVDETKVMASDGITYPGNIKTWTGFSVEESIIMTEDRDKWRKYVYGVANPRIADG